MCLISITEKSLMDKKDEQHTENWVVQVSGLECVDMSRLHPVFNILPPNALMRIVRGDG